MNKGRIEGNKQDEERENIIVRKVVGKGKRDQWWGYTRFKGGGKVENKPLLGTVIGGETVGKRRQGQQNECANKYAATWSRPRQPKDEKVGTAVARAK